MGKRMSSVIIPDRAPYILSTASVVGKKEGEGPLGKGFDHVEQDAHFGQKTFEKAESFMQSKAAEMALSKALLKPCDIDIIFAGDLLNQCTASCYGLVELNRPMVGLFGACSTSAEGLAMGVMALESGFADHVLTITSSHFCTAERQFRLPLNYGGQRTPTAQWTVTGSGAFVLGNNPISKEGNVRIKAIAIGAPVDMGITDANNMGAAMAPAAIKTLTEFFTDSKTTENDFDLIVTGDLGHVGHSIVKEQIGLSGVYNDCGLMIFDRERQDVHAGASGCGCSASVLASNIITRMRAKELSSVLFTATGALMSPTSAGQGESILGIAHAIWLESV